MCEFKPLAAGWLAVGATDVAWRMEPKQSRSDLVAGGWSSSSSRWLVGGAGGGGLLARSRVRRVSTRANDIYDDGDRAVCCLQAGQSLGCFVAWLLDLARLGGSGVGLEPSCWSVS